MRLFCPVTLSNFSQEIRTKNKRKRVVDEEITTKVFVWNSNEFQQEENDESALSELEQPDPCMRSQREITLHERDELAENDDRHVSINALLIFRDIFTHTRSTSRCSLKLTTSVGVCR